MLGSSQCFWKARRISLGDNNAGLLVLRSTQPRDIPQTTKKYYLAEAPLFHYSCPRSIFTTLNLIRKSELPL